MKRIFLLSILLLSCGKTSPFFKVKKIQIGTSSVAYSEDFSYSFFGEEACQTGEHKARTLAEICDKLLDNELNNNCAESERIELYQNECS